MRRRKVKRPRRLDARQVRQILSRGGLLLRRHGAWLVFRTADCRRMRIGIAEEALVAALEAEGVVRPIDGAPSRLRSA